MPLNKILVVEDDPVQVLRLCDVLKATNAELIVASNGRQAIEKAESEMPDLILMDIVMPDVDGFSACRQITQSDKTKDIPVVVVSSKNQDADKVWAQLQGARAVVGKPYTEEDILEQVRAYE